MDNKDAIHIYKWNIIQLLKEWNNATCYNMIGLQIIKQSEMNQTEKDKYMYDIAYMCNLKKKII